MRIEGADAGAGGRAISKRKNLGIEMEASDFGFGGEKDSRKSNASDRARAREHSVLIGRGATVDVTDLPADPPPPPPEFVIISLDGCGPNLFYVEGGRGRRGASSRREGEREGDEEGRKEGSNAATVFG